MDNIEFLETIIKGINPFTGEIISKASLLKADDVIGRFEELLSELKKSNDFELVYSVENIKFLSTIIEGKNPITNLELNEEDPLIIDYIVECLREMKNDYEIISNGLGSNRNAYSSNCDVSIDTSQEQINQYREGIIFSNRVAIKIIPSKTTIQPFCKNISNAINNDLSYYKIQNSIQDFLLQEGKLKLEYSSGRLRKYATAKGEEIGISNELIQGLNDKMIHRVFYSSNAQVYIIDKLSLIFHKK